MPEVASKGIGHIKEGLSGTIPRCDHSVADATPPLLGTNERTSLLVKE